MSECVVRMEMPKSCYVCPCIDDYGDYPRCRISGEQRGYNFPIDEKRMSTCPILCQLPEGHGRLADADAVESIIRKWFEEIKLNPDILLDGVKSLPTIVPAERSET